LSWYINIRWSRSTVIWPFVTVVVVPLVIRLNTFLSLVVVSNIANIVVCGTNKKLVVMVVTISNSEKKMQRNEVQESKKTFRATKQGKARRRKGNNMREKD
jgi:uncharacterized membrane-anchored protein YitT (DUF2179 family)